MSDEIRFSDCHIERLTKLLDYDFGASKMQARKPLKTLTFHDTVISDIEKTSIFYGHGHQTHLIFDNVVFDCPQLSVLVTIDRWVTIEFMNCQFLKPTLIQLENNTAVPMAGTITKKIINENYF